MIEIVSSQEPKLIATLKDWSRVNITVLDNNTLFLGAGTIGKQELLSSAGGILGGHKVDKTHPFQDWFIGELWWIGSIDGMLANVMISSPLKSQSRFGV